MNEDTAPVNYRTVTSARLHNAAIRALFVLAGVMAWFVTQSLIAARGFPEGIGDRMHFWLTPATDWLATQKPAADILLIATSGVIDLLGCFLLVSAIIGPSIKPFLGLAILFILRQICQSLTALPPPDGMIWRDPGFPSLLVTYGTANDFFFSGHTAIAAYGAMELAKRRIRWLTVAGTVIVAIEALTVLVLRAHYTMDVLAAILAAGCASNLAARLAPCCDRALSRAVESSTPLVL